MGWNTTVVVMNDATDMIAKDTTFGASLASAMLMLNRAEYDNQYRYLLDVPARSGTGSVFVNAATVIEQHHADNMVAVAVGGNTGRSIGYAGHYDATDEEIVRRLASDLGYRLVRKSR